MCAQQCVELTLTNGRLAYFLHDAEKENFLKKRRMSCSVLRVSSRTKEEFSGDLSDEVTPGPIPNPAVKLVSADGSAWVTACKSRSLPENSSFAFSGQRCIGERIRGVGAGTDDGESMRRPCTSLGIAAAGSFRLTAPFLVL